MSPDDGEGERGTRPFPEARRILAAGLPYFFYIETGSMHPVLPIGGRAEARPCAAEDLTPGDIACIDARPGPLLIHRYVGSYGRAGRRCVVTKGDRLPEPDPPVDADRVLGRVVSVSWRRLTLRLDGRRGRLVGRLVRGSWALAGPLRLVWRSLAGAREVSPRRARTSRAGSRQADPPR